MCHNCVIMHTYMNDMYFQCGNEIGIYSVFHVANYVYSGAHTYVSGIIAVFWIRIRIDLALPDPDLFWE